MGSCQCCQSSKLCDPVEEVQGLLNSSDSKASTKTDACEVLGIEQALEAERKSKEPIDQNKEDEDMYSPSPKSTEVRSSYSVVIPNLHINVSCAEPASQSASPIFQVSEQLVEAAATALESSKPQDIQTSSTDTELDSVKAQVDVERADVTKETEACISNAPTNEYAAAKIEPMVPGESEALVSEMAKVSEMPSAQVNTKKEAVVDIEKLSAKLEVKVDIGKDVEKPAAVKDSDKPVAVVDSEKPAAVVEVKEPAVVVELEQPACVVDSVKPTTLVDLEKPVAVVEVNTAYVVDSQKPAVSEKTDKPADMVDLKNQAAVDVVDANKPETVVGTVKLSVERNVEVDVEKPAVVVDIEKPATEVDVKVDSKENYHEVHEVLFDTMQPDLNSTIVKPEVKGLLTSNVPAQTREVAEPQLFSSGSPEKVHVAVKSMPPCTVSTDLASDLGHETEAKLDKDVSFSESEMKEDNLQMPVLPQPFEINEPSAQTVENGHVCDTDHLKDDKMSGVNDRALQETEKSQTVEETQEMNNKVALLAKPTADCSRTTGEVQKPESTLTLQDQKETEFIEKAEAEGTLMNGLSPLTPEDTPEPIEPTSDAQVKATDTTAESKATEPGDLQKESASAPQPTQIKETTQPEGTDDPSSPKVQKEEIIQSTKSPFIALSMIQCLDNVEDLYRGDDEIMKELLEEKPAKPVLEFTLQGVGTCSLSPAIDILSYSEKEWKGNTAKSNLIRKGYSEMSCSFTGLRRVRGDNYCSLRATLYQVLANTTQPPPWLLEEDFTLLPERLEAQERLIGSWTLPPQCSTKENKDAVQKLKSYLELLQRRWQEAAELENVDDKQRVCESVFEGGEEEYGLLEVLKLLMLAKAVELFAEMQEGHDVPVFCWLLFARDTSENPRMFFTNHLSQVGFSGGLEQVEMFLLGYALQHTIQTFRLYKFDTEEFVTHYPDDHKQDWPCVCIVTEDDRHYNVPVRKPAQF